MGLLQEEITRRSVIAGAGGLVVGFSLGRAFAQELPPAMPPAAPVSLPGSLDDERFLDSWIRIDPDNSSYLDSLGWAYFKLGKLDLAEENLKRALQIDSASATINELVEYSFTPTASDIDYSGQTLTLSLVGAPAGA